MKILLSFLQDKGGLAHPVPSYRFWSYYMKNGIEEAGMKWVEVPDADWAEGLLYDEHSIEIKNWKAGIWERTLKYIKSNLDHIEIFLTYLYPKQIDVNAITEIKSLGIPCVNFYCDNIREFNSIPPQFNVFDLMWVPEYEALEMYKKAHINCISLPMPMWVEKRFRKQVVPEEKAAVSFIGSKDILREQLLGDTINKGLPIEIWGPGWLPDFQPPVKSGNKSLINKLANQLSFIKTKGLRSYLIKYLQQTTRLTATPIDVKYLNPAPGFEEYINIIQYSKVTLGVNRVPTFKRLNTNPLKYSRLRDIEAPMMGACYLTEYCSGLSSLYDMGNDIYAYENVEELVYKANGLLKDKSKRQQLRINGQKRALNEHSIPASLKKIKTAFFK